jgi:hypothetical protein
MPCKGESGSVEKQQVVWGRRLESDVEAEGNEMTNDE